MPDTPPKAAAPKSAAVPKRSGKAGRQTPNRPAPVVETEPAVVVPAGRSLAWAVRLLYAEAVVTGLLALVTIWLAVAADNASVQSAIAWPAFVVLIALVWAGLGTALRRRKSLARGPAIVLQMLLIPIGYYMIAGGLAWLGVPVMVVGLFGSGLLLAPSTRTALGMD